MSFPIFSTIKSRKLPVDVIKFYNTTDLIVHVTTHFDTQSITNCVMQLIKKLST